MRRWRRVALLVRYTWLAARRRRLVWTPPVLVLLLALAQLPRIASLCNALARPAGRSGAVAEYARLVEAIYHQCLLVGSILALALGAAATGARGSRARLLPVLARPVSRFEFLLGKWIGNALVLVLIWLVPALGFEAVRAVVDAPVRIALSAYLAPLPLHLVLLAAGVWLGTWTRALPATLLGIAGLALVLTAQAGRPAEPEWLAWTCTAAHWFLPPLGAWLATARPFASPYSASAAMVLYAQGLLWIGIFLGLADRRFARIDFDARSP